MSISLANHCFLDNNKNQREKLQETKILMHVAHVQKPQYRYYPPQNKNEEKIMKLRISKNDPREQY